MNESESYEHDEVGALERARRRLYTTGTPNIDIPQPEAAPKESTVPEAWKKEPVRMKTKRSPVRLAAVFFGIALLFFVVAAAAAGYLLYFGGNTVSTDNIVLAVQGPTTIAGGDTAPLSITVTNKNPSTVQNVTLEVDFPNGTRSADNVLAEYPRYTENLGTLSPGQTVTRSVKAILFGAEGQMLTLPVSVSFATQSSNAVFVKRSPYSLSITSAPLSVSVQAPAEAVSGQPFNLALTVRSNAATPISNVVVAGEYPFGFSLASSSVASQNGSFVLGGFSPGQTKTVSMTGILVGTTNGQRVFHFTVGTGKSMNDPTLAISYMTQEADMTISAPFITASLSLNGTQGDAMILTPGTRAQGTLSYTNTLATPVTNAEVDIHIQGGSVDYTTVQTTTGFYRSADHTIVFSRDTDPSLATLQPSSSGLGTFSFSMLPTGVAPHESGITFTISVSGTRVGQTNVPEQITASQVITAKIASVVMLTARTLHSTGPFSNSGPLPPKPNAPTTYTVVWDVKNASNAVAGATVSTTLPSYVSFTNQTTPSGTVSYNDSTHTVTWNAGDLEAGASAEGAFQVSITPSTSQRGSAPALTGPATFSGYDRFAGLKISAQVDPVTTETPSDPGYSSTFGTVP